jgi:glycosyltransferase involved in cell wall biosynthesis
MQSLERVAWGSQNAPVDTLSPAPDLAKSRLLYLVGSLASGGLERQLSYLLRAMDRERYRPAVAVWSFCETDVNVPEFRGLGVPIHALPDRCSPLAKLVALRRLVRRLEPELIHSYSFYTNVVAYLAARAVDAVAVGSVRSDLAWAKKEAGRILGPLSAWRPRDQICNSYAALASGRAAWRGGVSSHRLVVRNGVDLEHFRRLPLDLAGPVRIVGVGNLLPVKRWDRLLLAACELKRRRIAFRVAIAGDGPLRNTLLQHAAQLDIADSVQFLGHCDDVPRLLADATFVAHTSESEGCPNAIIEAMACGRAVVAMDAGDIRSLVEEGVTGFVVASGDHAAFIERLAYLSTCNEAAKRMGDAARARVEREFTLERLVRDTFAAYRNAGWTDGADN